MLAYADWTWNQQQDRSCACRYMQVRCRAKGEKCGGNTVVVTGRPHFSFDTIRLRRGYSRRFKSVAGDRFAPNCTPLGGAAWKNGGHELNDCDMPLFVLAVFAGAFLLFSVQPMVAKFILPSFGGTAAVWATCMVVFQTLLLAGYSYAHLLRTKFSPRQQRWVHLVVLAMTLPFLPPVPHVNPTMAVNHPVWELLRAVLVSVGMPFFALAATAPLLMEWFRQSFPDRTADRLYAFSNAGSLVALISYPALIEPGLGGKAQALCWAIGLGLFLPICAITAWWPGRRSEPSAPQPSPAPVQAKSAKQSRNTGAPIWLWVALSACGSGMLLALTNQITQDVAPMPLLWVAPLAVYLLTFILCFESSRFYRRWFFMPACFVAFLLLAWLLPNGYLQGFWTQVGGYLAILFCACMLCHGELYRLRPSPERLTVFYLSLSLGGAIGGMFVALLAPVAFSMILETPIIVVGIAGLGAFILWLENFHWTYRISPVKVSLFATIVIAVSLGFALHELRKDSIHMARNFYGAYRVTQGAELLLDGLHYPLRHGQARVLHSGQIYHGLQFIEPDAATIATTYYGEGTGLSLAIHSLPATTNRLIGAIGLGIGTLATYASAGDHIRFYEVNPEVLRIAETWFTFLAACQGKIDVVLGDGRLSLTHEPPQNYDLFILDAFSGDSIPTHLLTREAMFTYLRHVKTSGILAFHISNSHLNLEPVVQALANEYHLKSVFIPATRTDIQEGKLPSVWMLLTADATIQQELVKRAQTYSSVKPNSPPRLWTDDNSSILSLLH